MKIAIEGCAHGELEKIYDTIEYLQKQDEKQKVDLLICCGDFQSTRNLEDLQTMAVKEKYQHMCTFYKYYSGEKVAPILTLFIGGNHEASNYLQELPYGGWVAPNIYYLGLAGVVNVNGIRIAGISGIYKGYNFLRGHFEFSPYDDKTTKRSVYHVRQLEVFRLKQLSGGIDICLSHDWPRGVYNYGNHQQLIRFKPHFKEEIDKDELGSPPCADLLNTLQPTYWFAAHLHCKFSALVPHKNSEKTTKFLALDKCLPKRRFLQVIEVEKDCAANGEMKFEYDLEWLTILHSTNHLLSVKKGPSYMPGPNGTERFNFTPTDKEKNDVLQKIGNNLQIPKNFCRTVEPYNPSESKRYVHQPKPQINPQTTQFCDLLGLDDPLSIAMIIGGHELSHSSILDSSSDLNSSSFLLDSSLNSSLDQSPLKRTLITLPKPKENPDEVDINSDDDDESNDNSEEDYSKNITMETTLDSSISPEKSANEEKFAIFEIESKTEESVDVSNPPVKKFKRRNQSIYADNDL